MRARQLVIILPSLGDTSVSGSTAEGSDGERWAGSQAHPGKDLLLGWHSELCGLRLDLRGARS